MEKFLRTSAWIGLLAAALAFVGCSKKSTHDHAHDQHDDSHHEYHVHKAPHGGTLVELGDHQFNLELVRDAAAGALHVYSLDAHAENFVRLPLPSLALVATVNGQARPLTLMPVANPATGETVGDTSQFSVQAEWLKTTDKFSGVIAMLEIRGAKFTEVKFVFPSAPSGAHDEHKHAP
jgi:hypothetical protein